MNKLDVTHLDVAGQRVLLRADLDVPLDPQGCILDDRRIRTSLPTIQYLMQQQASVVILAHLGRPEGIRRDDLSLRPVALRLAQLLDCAVDIASDCVGTEARAAANTLKPGEILVLENLRFHPGEEANEAAFAQQLAHLGDMYVNDAFGTSSRSHASITGIAKFFSRRAAGLHLIEEISTVESFMLESSRPFVLILGGAKVASKLGVIQNLLHKIDVLLVGGIVANTCLKALNVEVGSSVFADDMVEVALKIIKQAQLSGVEVVLPTDVVLHRTGPEKTEMRIDSLRSVPTGWEMVDIGPQSRAVFSGHIARARSLVWSGPLGMYESDYCIEGTESIAEAISCLVSTGARTLVGGGDTAASLKKLGLDTTTGYISVAGGAMLSFLAGKALPGIEVLTNLNR